MEKNKPDKDTALDEGERLETYLLDLKNDADAMRTTCDQADSDMRFISVDGGMWEGELDSNWASNRVRLQIDMVSDFVYTYIGGWDQKRIGVEYKPDGRDTSDEDCQTLNALYRTDYNDNSGDIAIDNAINECAICGYGCVKLAPMFEDDEDPENDNLRIDFRPIFNAYNSVFWDESSQRPDKQDANHVTQLEQYNKKGFERAFEGFTPSTAYDSRNYFFSTNSSTDLDDFYLVASRYHVRKKRVSIYVYNNLSTGKVERYDEDAHNEKKDELAKDDLREFVRERKIVQRTIEKTVFSGTDILKKTKRVHGKRLPLVPFYAIRAYIDGAEWYRGLVRKFKDPNRIYNMQISQVAENAGKNDGKKPIFDPEQMENKDVQDIWANMNNSPYLLAYALRDKDGNVIQHGPNSYLDPGQLPPSAGVILQTIPQYMQDATGSAPTEDVDLTKSGKHAIQLRKREERKTKKVDKGIEAGIQLTGIVYMDMAPEVYADQRQIATVDKDGKNGTIQLFETKFDDDKGGMVESNKIGGKKFKCIADIGQQVDTESEEVVETMKSAMEALKGNPMEQELTPPLMYTMIDHLHGAAYGPLKKMNRRKMLLQGLVEPENDEEKKFLQDAAEPRPDPQEKLVEAAAEQQLAEARNMDSDSVQNIADARKKAAETQKILAEIPNAAFKAETEREKVLLDAETKRQQQQARTGL